MSRDEALTACYVAARALKASTHLPVPEEPAGVIVAAPLLWAVFAAVDAVEAVGDVVTDPALAAETGLCTADADCWRYAVVPGGPCYHHSPQAHAPQVRRRDVIFEGVGDAE